MEQSLQTHYTIPELAKKAFMNEFKLKKGFKQLFNKSIHALHYELRMQKAIQLLKETDLRLEDIAREIGYHFLTSFISAFRRSYKVTPYTYRKSTGIVSDIPDSNILTPDCRTADQILLMSFVLVNKK